MKKNTIKKITLGVSTTYIIYFLLLILISSKCGDNTWCQFREDDIFGKTLFVFAPLVPLFLLSLLTFKMKDEVFTAWARFAMWWVPVIMLVTYLQSTQSGSGGLGIGGALSSGFDALVLGFFYFIFILVSLVIIVKKYRATR